MQYKLVNENFKENYGENLLHFRGVENVLDFLNPPISYLQSPLNLNEIKKGANLLLSIIHSKKPILIIPDCDVDGYTSAAIMYQYIECNFPEINLSYLTHSGKQHGLEDHIQTILDSEEEYGLIILPDSSSNDYIYHEQLKSKAPCLVLDHHELDTEVSDNAIIINNQISENYSNKELTGAGVVYQFCRYIDTLIPQYIKYDSSNFIDLAALGICGDMGSMIQTENRYICYTGFGRVKNSFFKAILDKQSYSTGGKINPMTVAFYVVPMINAMIRIGTIEEKTRLFEAFIHGNEMIPSTKRGAKGTLEKRAIESVRECVNARSHQNKILDKNVEKFEDRIYKYGLLDNQILFVKLEEDDDLPSELNGLLAMKLCAKYKKPTIVARLNEEGYDRGSIRNVNNCALTDLKAFLNGSGYFEYVQGHANAAGCSILDKDLNNFLQYANQELKDYDFGEGVYDVNFVRAAADKDIEDLIFDLDKYEDTWGQNNPQALIYIHDLNITKDDCQIMGRNKDTLKITKFGIAYMKFFAKDLIQELSQMNEIKINLIGKPNLNYFNGFYTPQIFIESYELEDGTFGF